MRIEAEIRDKLQQVEELRRTWHKINREKPSATGAIITLVNTTRYGDMIFALKWALGELIDDEELEEACEAFFEGVYTKPPKESET